MGKKCILSQVILLKLMSPVMAVITRLGFKRLKLTFLLASWCRSSVSQSMRSITANWFNGLSFSNFWDIQIYFKPFKRAWLSQNNSKVIWKSMPWKVLQGSGTYFFQQWNITWKKGKNPSNKPKRLGCLHSCLQAIALSFVHWKAAT